MRKISNDLLNRFIRGDLIELLKYIKSDPELRLEVRRNGDAFIYYRKGKALEVGRLKVDKKYGNVPDPKLAISDPKKYFEQVKVVIDSWLTNNKNRGEFDTQQKIATDNQSKKDKYLIIDMEYAFEQNIITKDTREKRAVFDLLGIERKTGEPVFFEIKKGMGATKGSSGIDEHIKDYINYIHGKNSKFFRSNLHEDVRNIIDDKVKLGLISNFVLPANFDKIVPELIFVFHPKDSSEIAKFNIELNRRKELILVSDKSYKLK